MGSQGGDDNREKHFLHLTLNEIQNQLGDTGKPVRSMNLVELLKIVFNGEANHFSEASLSLTSSLCNKTIDEIWRDMQENKDNKDNKCVTLGEITLEDLLVKAGIVVEPCASAVVVNQNVVTPQFPQQGPWIQYPQAQYELPQQGLMGIYMTSQNMAQSFNGRKRGTSEDMVDKTFERRQKRMIKNRESAARSREKKQAYTIELKQKVLRLEEENEKLKRQKEIEKILSSVPPQKPRYQIRRTSSASF